MAMNHTHRALAACSVAIGSALIARHMRGRSAFHFRDRTVLITGGSRGLGLLLARELGALGARLTIAARNADELARAGEDLAARGIDAALTVCDVTDRESAQQLVANVVDRTGRIDVLINNAGVISVGPIDHMTLADFEEALAIHFWGPLYTMRAALPAMRRQGGGRIVNISSIGGKVGIPHLVPYCASKFALAGLSEALAAEVARDGIYVTTVYPGLMRTGSPLNAWFKGRNREEFTWFAITDSLPVLSIHGARAARQIADACRRGDAELIIGWPAKMAVAAKAVLPETVALALAGANIMLPEATGESGNRARPGWQSVSDWAPSRLTQLSDRAAAENNELPSTGD
jgi:NAD(P)-dependent dehydrogenase (short-subunit alcohol dehydrogenase family)